MQAAKPALAMEHATENAVSREFQGILNSYNSYLRLPLDILPPLLRWYFLV